MIFRLPYAETLSSTALPHAARLDNYLPQVLLHRDTPHTCCHRRHCARESRRQPFRGQGGNKRDGGGGGVMLMTCECVWACDGVRK